MRITPGNKESDLFLSYLSFSVLFPPIKDKLKPHKLCYFQNASDLNEAEVCVCVSVCLPVCMSLHHACDSPETIEVIKLGTVAASHMRTHHV